MKRLLTALLFIFASSFTAKGNEIELIKERIIKQLTTKGEINELVEGLVNQYFKTGPDSDDCLRVLVKFNPPQDKAVETILKTMSKEGSWSDINYASKERSSWPLLKHIENMLVMARGYKSPSCKFYGDTKVRNAVFTALEFWSKGRFYCPNWWPNRIGVPKSLAPVMLLLENEMTPELKAKGMRVLNGSKISMTGQNRVWLSNIVFMKGLLLKDSVMMKEASAAIREQMKIATPGAEGLQPDYSFHQHGTQLQNGNYGLAFADMVGYWMYMLDGTSYQFTKMQIEEFRNFLLKGFSVAVYNGCLDVSSCGRQLFRNAQEGKAAAAILPISYMMQIDKDRTAQKGYKGYLKRNYTLPYKNDLCGNFNFEYSKYMIHRTKDFCFTLRMSSKKVLGGEVVNSENLKGYHLGDGATMIYHKGGEYSGIFPIWNGKYMPGTTVKENDLPLKVLLNNAKYLGGSNFVGGASMGMYGVAVMDYERDGVMANKSWFFINDKILCLGNSIISDGTYNLITTLEQNFSRSTATYYDKGVRTAQKEQSYKTKVVMSDGVGYTSLDNSYIECTTKEQKGSWHDVALFLPKDEVKGDVFTAQIRHSKGTNGSYAYLVEPAINPKELFDKSRKHDFKIIRNNDTVTAIESKKEKIAMFIFHKEGAVHSEIFGLIKSENPIVFIVKGSKDRYNTSINSFDKEVKLWIDGDRYHKER